MRQERGAIASPNEPAAETALTPRLPLVGGRRLRAQPCPVWEALPAPAPREQTSSHPARCPRAVPVSKPQLHREHGEAKVTKTLSVP